MNQYLCLSSGPPQLCKLPRKIFSPFLARMAKKAGIARMLNQIPAPSTCPQSVRVMQWSNPGCMQTSPQCAAYESLAWYTSALLWQWGDQVYQVPMLVLEMMAKQNSLVQRWISLISSSVSPPSSSTWSLDIWDTPILDPLMWAVLQVTVCAPMG